MSLRIVVSRTAVLLAVVALLVASCGPAAPKSVKLACVGPLTGPDGVDGKAAALAAELAVDQANAAGGICGGMTVEFEAHDSGPGPKEGANIAAKLCGEASVFGVAADYASSVSLAEAPVFNECGLTQVVWYAAAPEIPKKSGKYTFRIYPPGENMSMYLADWLINRMGWTRFASWYTNNDYGIGLNDVFVSEVERLGGEIVGEEAVLPDQTDLSAIIAKFKDADPQAIFGGISYQSGAYWCMQADEMGLEAPLYAVDGIFAPEYMVLGGEHVEGSRTVAAYSLDSTDPVVAGFVQAYRDAYGQEPTNSSAYSYDAIKLLLEALDATDCKSRDAVQEWFATNMTNKKGVSGVITLDEYGERIFEPDMYIPIEVRNGEWVEVTD